MAAASSSVFSSSSADHSGHGLAAQGRANSAGALPASATDAHAHAHAWWYDASTLPPLATADLRGGVNVVTGVGTMQHLYCAFGSRRGTAADREPLAGLAVEPAEADVLPRAPSADALSASLIRNDHGQG